MHTAWIKKPVLLYSTQGCLPQHTLRLPYQEYLHAVHGSLMSLTPTQAAYLGNTYTAFSLVTANGEPLWFHATSFGSL
jgi:hypothetical protein